MGQITGGGLMEGWKNSLCVIGRDGVGSILTQLILDISGRFAL